MERCSSRPPSRFFSSLGPQGGNRIGVMLQRAVPPMELNSHAKNHMIYFPLLSPQSAPPFFVLLAAER